MSKPLKLALFCSLICSVWLLNSTTANGNTTYGCYIASPPHTLVSPGNVRTVSGPSDCIAGETSISWDVFPVGLSPAGVSFDGANIWVSNQASNTVTKLRASDGANLGTFPAGPFPGESVFDGENIWITNFTANTLTKLRASDGSFIATIPVRPGPAGLAFDGTNIWVSSYYNNSVSRRRLSDGAELGNTPGVNSPLDVLFDGANIWAANNTGSGTVTRIGGSSGAISGVSTLAAGFPGALGFDGANIWVLNGGTQNVSRVQASNGTVIGALPVGFGPAGIAFDGTNMWVANEGVVLKYRADDGALLGSFPGSYNGSGRYETAVVFDGTYVWVANYTANTVTRYLDGTLCCDSIAPTTTVATNTTANVAGWNNSDVTISLSASDNTDGSGVKEITYSATGAQTITPTTVEAASVNFSITAEGETNITYFATDVAGNTEAAQSLVIEVDKSLPSVSCDSADGLWHAADVSISCTANDSVSGLSNGADSSFNLATNVPANTETANAATNSRTICDLADNCVTAGPIGGNKVDMRAPVITITAPTATTYLLNQVVTVSFNCSDAGSGIGSCVGTTADGGQLDTASTGAKAFTVNASDNVGNGAPSSVVNYTVNFASQVLFDQSKAHKSGSTVPVKIRLVDANGANVSSAATLVHAVSVVQTGSQASAVLEDAGNANPDFDFRYDAILSGYIFNLKTTGFGTGSYILTFTAGGGSTVYSVGFQVRQ